jgi:hypothetical protein
MLKKNMPDCTNESNVKVISLDEIFPDITNIRNGGECVS